MSVHRKTRIFLALVTIGVGIGACGREEVPPGRDQSLPTLCYVPFPESVELSMAAEPLRSDARLDRLLERDLPGHGQVFEFMPETQKQGIDQKRGRYAPRRIFFVARKGDPTIGSLWMMFGHLKGKAPATEVIASGLDRTKQSFVTDGKADSRQIPFDLYRIAIVDRNTRVGPTYVSHYSKDHFVRYEHDSDYVKNEWQEGECRGRPLTAIPREWEEERDRRLAKGREKKWFGS